MTSPRLIGRTDRRQAPRKRGDRPNGSIASLDQLGRPGRPVRGMKHASIAAITNSQVNSVHPPGGYEWSVD
jgi:hypothetical protein